MISISPVILSYDLLVTSAFGYNALIYYYAKLDWDQYPHPPQYVIDTKYINTLLPLNALSLDVLSSANDGGNFYM